jgi:autotransporter-associated beta strand protein
MQARVMTARSIRRIACTLVAGLTAWLAAGSGRAEFVIARDGAAVATIVSGGHAEQAELLRDRLREITGATLPIVGQGSEAEGKPRIELAVADAIPGLSAKPTALQGYRLAASGDRLALTARTPRGLTYAVEGLLAGKLGVRFLTPDLTLVPKSATLTLADCDEVTEPALPIRSVFLARDGKPDPWELANRGGGLPDDLIVARHNFYDWAPPAKWFDPPASPDDTAPRHPEWYVLTGGKRQKHWLHGLCYTNPDLAKAMAANIAAEIRARKLPEHAPIPVGQGDGFVACECDSCRKVARENGSESGTVIVLLNRILAALAAEFPRHQLVTFAYSGTLQAPSAVKPHPNLWVTIVSSNADMLNAIPGNPRAKAYEQACLAWPRLAPGRVTIWHWSSNFVDQTVEWPNLYPMADNFKFWRDAGIAGVTLQTTGPVNWGWLKQWVWLQLMWNPDAPVEPLVREFLAGYYGPKAAPILADYFRLVDEARRTSGYASDACDGGAANAHAMLQGLYKPDTLARMQDLLDRAEAAAAKDTDPEFAKRIAFARAFATDQLAIVAAAGVPTHPGGYFYPPEKVPLHRVVDPRDKSAWLVPGTSPALPAHVERIDAARAEAGMQESGAAFMYRFWFQRGAGGKLAPLASPRLAVEVCPNLLAAITSIIHKPSGKELLAGRFPQFDWPSGACAWRATAVAPAAGRLDVTQSLQNHEWFDQLEMQRFTRSLALDADAAALAIGRRFTGEKLYNAPGMPAESRFPSAWTLAVPEPTAALLTIDTGGGPKQVPLALPAEVTVAVALQPAEDRPHAVSPDEAGSADVAGLAAALDALPSDRRIEVLLDRGDGLAVRLRTPAAGWESVAAKTDPVARSVTISFGGGPVAMSREENVVPLPGISFEVVEDREQREAAPPAFTVTDKGRTYAVKENDELGTEPILTEYAKTTTFTNAAGKELSLANDFRQPAGATLAFAGGDFKLTGTVAGGQNFGPALAPGKGVTLTLAKGVAGPGDFSITTEEEGAVVRILGTSAAGLTRLTSKGVRIEVGADDALGPAGGEIGISGTPPVFAAHGGPRMLTRGIFSRGFTVTGEHDLTLAGPIKNAENYVVDKRGPAALVLAGPNPEWGNLVRIREGAVRLADPGALGSCGVALSGGVLELAAGDFTASLSAAPRPVRDELGFLADGPNGAGGGFAAKGAARSVNLGGKGATLLWGSGGFVAEGQPLVFGSRSADAALVFANPIDLGGQGVAGTAEPARTLVFGARSKDGPSAPKPVPRGGPARTIVVLDNPDSAADRAVLAAPLAGLTDMGLVKRGAGTLIFAAANRHLGDTLVEEGTVGGAGRIAGNLFIGPGGGLLVDPRTTPEPLTVGGGVVIADAAKLTVASVPEKPGRFVFVRGLAGITGSFASATGLTAGWRIDTSLPGELALAPAAK